MDALRTTVEWVTVFVAGLVIRAAIFAALLGVLIIVLLPFVYAFEGGRRLVRRLRGIEDVHGFEWRRGLRYAPAHLWLREHGRMVRIGLDSVAACVLGVSDSVDLPFMGQHVAAGDPLATFTIGRTLVAVPAPIAGVVAGVNARAGECPSIVSREPHASGWLVEVRPDSRTDVRALPTGEHTREWFGRDAMTLTVALEHAAGYAAADGGEPLHVHPPELGETARRQLASDVLHARVVRLTAVE